MDTKCLLDLILIVVLQFQASISETFKNIYHSSGEAIVLPCATTSPDDTTCSEVYWLYQGDQAPISTRINNGNVIKSSARAARLSVGIRCSLAINNISAEDYGQYVCRQGTNNDRDISFYLNVLTISPSPPDGDPKRDDEVTLECSLLTDRIRPCEQNSIRWVNETGSVLRGEGVGYRVPGQTNCVSVLTVKRQSGHNRRYTCQFVKDDDIKTEADYTPVFTDPSHTLIIIGAVAGAAIVLVVIAAVIIKYRKRAKVTKDVQKPTQHLDEPEINLTYVTVSHANQQASPYKKIKKEEVMYSIVKTVAKTEADDDPSSLYSYVS